MKFFTLRIYRGDFRSWYNNFGYEINFNTPRVQGKYPSYNQEIFNNDMTNLHSFPMNIVENLLNNIAEFNFPSPFDKIILEDGLQAKYVLEKYPNKFSTLGEYMSTLWSENCDSYTIFDKFLRTTSRQDIDLYGNVFPWGPLLRRIEFVGYDFINNLSKQCH